MNAIDSSVLVFAMDPTTPEHSKAKTAVFSLSEWMLNPTIIHELYHTLVFKRGMLPNDAKSKLRVLVNDERTIFFNITKTVSLYSLDLAAQFNLGGRDSLIVGCCMHNNVESMLTHDRKLVELGRINFKARQIEFNDPIA